MAPSARLPTPRIGIGFVDGDLLLLKADPTPKNFFPKISRYVPNWQMEHNESARQLAGTCLAFTPVPAQRHRADGWTPETQANFIRALEAMGSVGQAAKAVGMGRRSAYRLLKRPGAESFALAWDRAVSMGRMRQFDYAMDRALNGITTVRVLRGGSIDVSGGPDMAIVRAALREDAAPLKATKDTI